MQEIHIKYIPDIFPSIDFESSIIIDSYYYELPAITTIAKTQEKWATIDDFVKINRKIQGFIEKRVKFEWITVQEIDYPLIQVADNVIVITNDNRELKIYDVKITYTEISSSSKYKITLECSIKEQNNISNFLSSKNCEQKANSNYIEFGVDAPVFQFYLENFSGENGIAQIPISNEEEFSLLIVGNEFYWHSDISRFNEDKTSYKKAWISGTQEAKILNLENSFILSGESFTGNITLDYYIDSWYENPPIIMPFPISFKIFTSLQPKKTIKRGKTTLLTSNLNVNFYQFVNIREILKCKFYLDESEIWKAKYFDQAGRITFFDKKNNKNYHILETPNSINPIERNDLIDLYEFDFNGLISNINTKELY